MSIDTPWASQVSIILGQRSFKITLMDFLSFFALGMIIFVILVLAYGMIAIHDIPFHVAKKRNHPHQDAIHTAGWVSLFTLHAIWPFLFCDNANHSHGGWSGD